MHIKSLVFALAPISLFSITAAQLNLNIGDLGSISQLTYRDLGSMYSLETRSLTDKYETFMGRDAETSVQAAPSGIWKRTLVRAAGEALGVPERWLPTSGQNSGKAEGNVIHVRGAELDGNLEATLVQRSPTPCSHS